jgi:hypothetical protein
MTYCSPRELEAMLLRGERIVHRTAPAVGGTSGAHEEERLLDGRVGARRRDEEQHVDQTRGARGALLRRCWLRRADAFGEALDGAKQVVGDVEVRQVRLRQALEHLRREYGSDSRAAPPAVGHAQRRVHLWGHQRWGSHAHAEAMHSGGAPWAAVLGLGVGLLGLGLTAGLCTG